MDDESPGRAVVVVVHSRDRHGGAQRSHWSEIANGAMMMENDGYVFCDGFWSSPSSVHP